MTARSYHMGQIVNLLLMDSGVRPIAAAIDLQTWRALGTRGSDDSTANF